MARQNSENEKDEIQRLLDIISRPKANPKFKSKDRTIDRFIKECNIKEGTTRVPAYIIYYAYHSWKRHRQITRVTFFRIFSKMFQKTQVFRGTGYFLDPSSFDLTPEGFFKARALLRREKQYVQRKKKEKDTKKSDEIS